MVAVVAGAGLGLERSSGWVLGSRGQLGSASFNRYGENVHVNAATGNLVISRTDEILIGMGPDNVLTRTYNSLGSNGHDQLGDSNDHWQLSTARRVGSVTGGTVGTQGTTVTLFDWDGSEKTFTCDANQKYWSKDGAGAYDTMTYSASAGEWTWTDGNTGVQDFYAFSSGRLRRSTDTDGNTLSYTYANSRLSQITTANGETTALTWDSGGNLTGVTTTLSDTTVINRVAYSYDSAQRLSTVTTYLTPDDIANSESVTTLYTYEDSVSKRVTRIEQTGGARLDVTYYDQSGGRKVQTITITSAAGVTRATHFSYASGANSTTVATITDAFDQDTILTSDSNGQLIKIELPPASVGAAAQISTFEYDSNGNVISVVNGSGNATQFEYDSVGNLVREYDELGNTIDRAYDSQNRLTKETRYHVPDPGGSEPPSEVHVTRFAYDSEHHLRYVVSAEGHVTEHVYFSNGTRKASVHYRDQIYDVAGAISEDDLDDWVADINDLSTVARTDYTYDARGNLSTATSSSNAAQGTGAGEPPVTVTHYVYDQFGSLLERFTDGIGNSEEFLYDGLGRLTTSVDLNDATTSIVFDDAGNTTTLTLENGYVTASTYNLAGELINVIKGGTGASDPKVQFSYDDLGRLRMVEDTLGAKTYYVYDRIGRKVADISADRSIVEYGYDASNRLVKTVGYANLVTQTNIDSLLDGIAWDPDVELEDVRPGLSNDSTKPDQWEWRIHDAADRLVEVINGGGQCTVFEYDGASNLVSTTSYFNVLDPETVEDYRDSTPVVFDDETSVPEESEHDSISRNFHDEDGRLVGVLDGNGYLSQIIYDGAGRKIETIAFADQVDPEAETLAEALDELASSEDIHSRCFYDGRGLLYFELDGNLRPTQYIYNDAGQLINRIEYATSIESHGSYSLEYVQDQIEETGFATSADRKSWLVHDDVTGRLAYSIDALGGVTSYGYDELGRVNKQVQFSETCADPTTIGDWQDVEDWADWVSGNDSDADRMSRTLYDGPGRLAYQVDAEGYVTHYQYDTEDRLTAEIRYAESYADDIEDTTEAEDMAAILPDPEDLPPSAIKTRYEYDPVGRLQDTYDGEGVRTRIDYDALGRVKDRTLGTGQDARIAHYVYDAAGRVKEEVRAFGSDEAATTTYAYDGLGRLTDITQAAGETYETTTHYAHDKLGRVLSETQAFGIETDESTTTYSYNAFGEMVSRTAAADTDDATTTTYQYDFLGRLESETRADGADEESTTAFSYDAFGGLTLRTTAGISTHYTYDKLGRLDTETQGFDTTYASTVTYAYDAFGNVASIEDGRGNTAAYTYDRRGLALSSTDPLSKVTDYVYDAFGNLVQTKYPHGETSNERPTVHFYYDKLNRLTLQVDQERYATETTYSFGGEVETVTRCATRIDDEIEIEVGTPPDITADSEEDAVTAFAHDKLGRVTAVTDAEGETETYAINELGQRTSVTNKLDGVTTYAYSKRGLLSSETIAITWDTSEVMTVTNTFEYDRRGNRITTTEAAGQDEERATEYTYDKLDRLTETRHDGVKVVDQETWLTLSGVEHPIEKFIYDERSNLIESQDASGARTLFYYDALDRKIAEINALGTLSEWTHDANGNVTSVKVFGTPVTLPEDPGGTPPAGDDEGGVRETAYEYDANNRLKKTIVAGLWTGEVDENGDYIAANDDVTITNTYDDLGNVVRQLDGRGNKAFFYYDKLNRKIAQVDQENYLTFYHLDADGNVTKEERFATPLESAATTDSDPAELRSDVNGLGPDRTTRFEYDRNGRRILEQRLGVVAYTINANNGTLNEADTIAEIAYQYNALGEVTMKVEATGDTTTYEYDSAGRQIRITGQIFTDVDDDSVTPTTELSYDRLNNLTQSVILDSATTDPSHRTTLYTYDYERGGRLKEVTDANGFVRTYGYDVNGRVIKESYVRHDSLEEEISEANVTRYDALGRVILQSVATEVEEDAWVLGDATQLRYSAYGEIAARGVNIADVEDGPWQETFAYDNGGHMWRSTAGDGTVRLYLYDGNGAQTLVIASSGDEPAGFDWADISIEDAVELLTDGGNAVLGEEDVDGMVVTITVNDKRGQATETREPFRELADGAPETIVRRREYNAFGEVTKEIDPRDDDWVTDYTYNTLGKVIKRESPLVSYTDEDGESDDARPTEKYYYDLSGRLIGVQDANAVQGAATEGEFWHTNKRSLLAGTGYGGSEASVRTEFHADGGTFKRFYDVFGDMVESRNEMNKKELFQYDDMGRMTKQTHEKRTSNATALIDRYTYDELGRRITHWNNFLNTEGGSTAIKEYTDYDAQGRVIRLVDMGLHETAYEYTWDSAIATTGLGTFGGWIKETTNSSGRVAEETTDYFGRLVDKVDFGEHDYDFEYDLAGRLVHREIGDPETGDDVVYDYYNTGLLSSVESSFYESEYAYGTVTTSYEYDRQGNRTFEGYVADGVYTTWHQVSEAPDPEVDTHSYSITHQSATVAWDALNRMVSFDDAAVETKPVSIDWKYDLNGNIRNMASEYWALEDDGDFASTSSTYDFWYTYDSMNRFIVTKGKLLNGDIVHGPYGMTLSYDLAGRRHTKTTGEFLETWTLPGDPPEPFDIHYNKIETYDYSPDGYVMEVTLTIDYLDSPPEQGAPTDYTYTLATYDRDRMGRVTEYREFTEESDEEDVYKRLSTFNNRSQVIQDVVTTERDGHSWEVTTNYDFETYDAITEEYDGDYMGGAVTHHASTVKKDGTVQGSMASETDNTFVWWDSALQSTTTYDPDSGSNKTSTFRYDSNGHLLSVDIDDGRPRTVTFITDSYGQILKRDEEDDQSGGDPHEVHYYFNGMAVGDVSNNGTSNVDYATSIARHTATAATGGNAGAFAYGMVGGTLRSGVSTGTPYADFDQSYDAINGLSYENAPSRYVVREGDTLESVAYAIWGDSSFWYMIADANGLFGAETLIAGSELIIPHKIHNAHNNADVYRVYDPNEAIGDTSPTAPKPPKQQKGCGVFGQVFLAVIAVAVTVLTGSAAVGNFTSQVVGLATGIQRRFDWKGLAMAQITDQVSLGLKFAFGPAGSVAAAIGQAVAANVISQGIGLATGLQRKFDWTGVAAAGVMAGVGTWVGKNLNLNLRVGSDPAFNAEFSSHATVFVAGMASTVAGAATRTLIAGTDFGDNIIAVLPDVLGNTIGSIVASRMGAGFEGATVFEKSIALEKDGGIRKFYAPGTDGLLRTAHYTTASGERAGDKTFNIGKVVGSAALASDGQSLIATAPGIETVDVTAKPLTWLERRYYDLLDGLSVGAGAAIKLASTYESLVNNGRQLGPDLFYGLPGKILQDAGVFVPPGAPNLNNVIVPAQQTLQAGASYLGDVLSGTADPRADVGDWFDRKFVEPVQEGRMFEYGANVAELAIDGAALVAPIGGAAIKGAQWLKAGRVVEGANAEALARAPVTSIESAETAMRYTGRRLDVRAKFVDSAGAQSTSPGHSFATRREAYRLALNPEIERVTMDVGYNRLLRLEPGTISPNLRPDVGAVYFDKRVGRIEVVSETDRIRDLRLRNIALDRQIRAAGFNPMRPSIVYPKVGP